MRKLALSDDILYEVEKPARYIGNEINSVVKKKEDIEIRFCMCFPDVYEIGMSHLGIQILYDMFNQWSDIWCERVYSPWIDLDKIMREREIPLFALESQDPVKEFDFLGITIQYEMCYTNILQILDLSKIPLLTKNRTKEDPFVIGGGPCTYNPEPISDFFDLFYIGEGEVTYRELMDLYTEWKRTDGTREDFLHKAALIPGIYVPSLYQATYNPDGTILEFNPIFEDIPRTIEKVIVKKLNEVPYPEKPVVPFIKATQDRAVLEIQRGCIRGCRFCQAGQIYRPVRYRGSDFLLDKAKKILENTGHEEISLSSLSSSDYPYLQEVLLKLIDVCKENHVNISLPSLRIDEFSLDIMNKVQDIKKSSLTFAPEAGSQRLRDVINKGLTRESILEGCRLAFDAGWNRVKLYFMLGLPSEQKEDIVAIAELCNEIATVFFETVAKEDRNGPIQIVASTSFFIPKPFTPFQWAPMDTSENFIEKAYLTRNSIMEQVHKKRIKYNWHEAETSIIEGVLARGDRRLNEVIMKVYEKGTIFEAWGEYFNYKSWLESLAECDLNTDFYCFRKREKDEIFPWDFIDCKVKKSFLLKEWENALSEKVTPNCKDQCMGCGAGSFQVGICPSAVE